MDPLQALEELDKVIRQVSLPRNQHVHLMHCRQVIASALNKEEPPLKEE